MCPRHDTGTAGHGDVFKMTVLSKENSNPDDLNFLMNLLKGLGKLEKLLHNFASVGALAQLVEQRTLNP
jgi:hypothetical protein